MKNKITPTESIKIQIEANGFTTFVDAAIRQLKTMIPGTVNHAILEYLIENAVGQENARTWKVIEKHLPDSDSRRQRTSSRPTC